MVIMSTMPFYNDTNDHLQFDRNFTNMSPSDSKLKKENISTSEEPFLDLFSVTENKGFITRLYDKRDEFLFSISCKPHLGINIIMHL